jgi:hypothetical protein
VPYRDDGDRREYHRAYMRLWREGHVHPDVFWALGLFPRRTWCARNRPELYDGLEDEPDACPGEPVTRPVLTGRANGQEGSARGMRQRVGEAPDPP